MKITIKKFAELTTRELYAILQLRAEVFVVEQASVYQDLDNADLKALHITACQRGLVLAYARVLAPGAYFKNAAISRVLVRKEERGSGLGYQIVKTAISTVEKHFGREDISISAQLYLQKFYESFGFKSLGESYIEDSLPHIAMLLEQGTKLL